jgi:hypothetical protein
MKNKEEIRSVQPVDPTSDSNVFLEALASCAHASPGADRVRRPASPGDSTREESQGALAYGENHCQWCRDDECLVRVSGRGESEESLGESCFSSSNRLVRTRMLGGVGRVLGDGHPYPITSRL